MSHLQLFTLLLWLGLYSFSFVKGLYFEMAEIDGKANITGVRETDSFGTLYLFRGIPYAKPPIGDLRWQPPELLEATELNGFEAVRSGNKCMQLSRSQSGQVEVIGNEDCLYLNVYTRHLPKVSGFVSNRPPVPVIVYVHPGGFMYGSGENMGPGLFLRRSVVLVTINYRLGVLGFLSTNDENLPGNYGLLDQIKALEWVQAYIRYFGGDPSQVSLMGHSAGASAVHALTLSPRTNGLFSTAILQSGSALCDWAITKDPKKYAYDIGKSLSCTNSSVAADDDSNNSTSLVNCLKEKNGTDLIKAQQQQIEFWVLPTKLGFVIDGNLREDPVLPEHPEILMNTGNFTKVPLIVGITKDEGLLGYAFLHLNESERFNDNEYFHQTIVPKIIKALFYEKSTKEIEIISNAVDKYYFYGINVSTIDGQNMAITEMTNLFGDTMFYSCHWNMLEKYAAIPEMEVYNYVFSYRRTKSPKILRSILRELRKNNIHHPSFDFGVPHGEDMFYFFSPMTHFSGNNLEILNEQDMEVADFVTKLWVTFARDKVPQLLVNRNTYSGWRSIDPASPISYYEISGNKSEMGYDFRKGESLFWLRTVPLLEKSVVENEIHEELLESESFSFEYLFWIFLGISLLLLILILILSYCLYKKSRQGKAKM